MIRLLSLLKNYVGEDAVYNYINSMIQESKYCSDVIKKHFDKELAKIKEDHENFKKSTKCCACENDYVDNDVKVKDHCQITGKYRGFAHRGCNICFKLDCKTSVVFQNLKS